jgi:hypothetical protein
MERHHGLHLSGPVHEAMSLLGSGAIGQMQYHVLTNIMATFNEGYACDERGSQIFLEKGQLFRTL